MHFLQNMKLQLRECGALGEYYLCRRGIRSSSGKLLPLPPPHWLMLEHGRMGRSGEGAESGVRSVAWCRMYATLHTSHVTRHTSHVTRHTSHVTRHTSYLQKPLHHCGYICPSPHRQITATSDSSFSSQLPYRLLLVAMSCCH